MTADNQHPDAATTQQVEPVNDDDLCERWLMAMAEAGYPKTIGSPNLGTEFATFEPACASLAELRLHLKAYRLVGVDDLTDEQFFAWVVDHMDRCPQIYADDYRRDTKAHLAALRG